MGNINKLVSTAAKSWSKGTRVNVTATVPRQEQVIKKVTSEFLPGKRITSASNLDTVQLSMKKFFTPTEKEVKELLLKHSISGDSFCKGNVVLSQSFINKNNEIFLKRLDELYPALKGEKTAQIEDIMCCLENINHSGFKDKDAFLKQFIKDLDEVKLMTNKSGESLFDQGVTSLYSMKAILQAKYNNPERYQDIMNLYKLVRQGKAPDYILKGLIPEGKFDLLGKSDIDKLIQGKNYFEQFNKLTKPEDVLKCLQQGDVFSIGDKMFVRTADSFEPLNMSKSMYEKLFPPIERYCLAQNENSCHFVASLDGMIKNPEMRTRLYKMFEQTGEDTLKVRLVGNNTVPVEFDLKNIANLIVTDGAEGYLKGALGHKMIEHTVGVNWNNASKNASKHPLSGINNGGNPEVFDMPYLYGGEHKKFFAANKSILEKSNGNMLTVLRAENAKAVGKYKADPVNRNIGFTGGHVYSSQQGRLFNPWNTIESLPYPINEVPTPYAIYV